MCAEALARWQFAITTVYHFFFVPVTIGLACMVAGLQTVWVRRGAERYLRLTKFFGKAETACDQRAGTCSSPERYRPIFFVDAR